MKRIYIDKEKDLPGRQFKHLDYHARDRLQALLDAGESKASIARVLGVDRSTIGREIARNKLRDGEYKAASAETKAYQKRGASKRRGMKIEACPELRARIIAELKDKRSPDEIAGRLKHEGVTPRVGKDGIYDWLYSAYGQAYCRYLCTRRYRPEPQRQSAKRQMIPNAVSIHERPTEPNLVHAQGDTWVSGKKTGSTAAAALLVLEDSKLLMGGRMGNLRPVTMQRAVRRVSGRYSIDTLTLDRGIENKQHAKFGVSSYFCDPHSPWQKPLVEQSIGLLRRLYKTEAKKGTDLATISPARYQQMLQFVNHKYRKSLDYRSAYEVALEGGIIQEIPTRCVAFGPRI